MSSHIPVMLAEVVAQLAPHDGGAYLDGTFGGGGYARAILDHAACTLWAIDRDPDAIERGASLVARHPGRLHLLRGQFGDMVSLLHGSGVTALDGLVLDLGVSSFQLDDAARGFSFRMDGPLDMRMGKHGPTAADLVNTLPERELADVLYQFGEERASRRIAHAIVAARAEAPIETTGRLASVIRAVLPPDRSGNHPATRSFQALRIKVNDELGQVEQALNAAASLLAPEGRLVVVSFHSLEDRIVKRFMTDAAGRTAAPSRHDPGGLRQGAPAQFRLLTTRALRPTDQEAQSNPRSRSARLRAMQRLASTETAGTKTVDSSQIAATSKRAPSNRLASAKYPPRRPAVTMSTRAPSGTMTFAVPFAVPWADATAHPKVSAP
jgi:16S rRNA (cytosine1402-N4)-methyltransferase